MKEYFLLAFNNLKRRKLRSWLTVLGIFIGIAAVVSLVSLGQGLQGYINEQFEMLGKDKIIIQPKGTFGAPGSGTSISAKLTKDDEEVVKDINGVEGVASFIAKTGKVEYEDEIVFQFVSGLPQDEGKDLIEETQSMEINTGRDLRDGEDNKIIVGSYYPEGKVFSEEVGIRDELIIEGKEFRIVGILEPIGNPADDSGIIMTLDAIEELYSTEGELSMIIAKAGEGEEINQLKDKIEEELRKSRDEEEDKETFRIQTAEQLLESFSSIFAVVQAVVVGIAAISLLVGGIGIMNTMYTAVLERTKEIGTMKAVGAKNSDVLLIFLFESGLLGLVGGVIGIGLGAGIAKGVEYIASSQLGTTFLKAYFGLPLIIGALLFSFIVGSLSGILPAVQASKLKPADALRYE
jgi:putative ABC transport system permease protein